MLDCQWDEICKAALGDVHSVFPVFEGHRENLLGVVSVKDLFVADHADHGEGLRPLLKSPLLVPPNRPLNKLLENFRASDTGLRSGGGRVWRRSPD